MLLIALLASAVPALLALVRFSEEREISQLEDRQRLLALAQDRVQELRQRILATKQLQFGLARASDLAGHDRAACSAFLSEVREAHPQYTGILTVNPDGRLFCDSLKTGRELDLNDRAYFRRSLSTRDGLVLEPVFGRLTGRAVMQVAYPVRRADGELRFVLLASLDLAQVLTPDGTANAAGQHLALLDDQGVLLFAWPAEGQGLKAGASAADTPLGRFALASRSAAVTHIAMPNGLQTTWARADTSGLADAGLRVLVGSSDDAFLIAAAQRFRAVAILYGGLAVALFLGLWLMAERSIRRPIARMTAMAGRLARGDLSARVGGPQPKGEIGELSNAFNRAAESLQAQRVDIERLNSRLQQSQRLEAVGQLTGGVAHDFNNLLTVVLGNADLLAEGGLDEPGRRQALEMLIDAAQRGAVLTRQLLAFARRQPLAPSLVDVNQLVSTLEPMLRRTLGEHIEVRFVPGPDLWPTLVDPTQLENALLNLCLNARDAMGPGGQLTLETANVTLDPSYAERHPEATSGPYTVLAVSDTGAGIDPKDLDRVFEPFFTTKEKGKGTGLGLAMVYGFASQSAGHVSIYSELGHGTTVKIFLPRGTGELPEHVQPAPPSEPRGSGERILVVEDDEPVRILACLELRAMGYQVVEADCGAQALELLRGGPQVDLLFTDVVMPGMSGRELSDAASALRPDLRVLFASGYTENAIVHNGRLDAGVQLLSKPYRRLDLARAVRAALDRDAS